MMLLQEISYRRKKSHQLTLCLTLTLLSMFNRLLETSLSVDLATIIGKKEYTVIMTYVIGLQRSYLLRWHFIKR